MGLVVQGEGEGGLRIMPGYSDIAQMGEMVTPFIKRGKKTLKEDCGEDYVRLGHVETAGDGYESLEIKKSGDGDL